MEIENNIKKIKQVIRENKKKGKKISFVPTMGSLHDGHLSLLELARKEGDILILSIFVNPIQFGKGEDLEKYPRDLQKDEKLAERAGVDYVFYPEVKEMYPEDLKTYVEVKGLTDNLCGEKRPGHFKGVTTVVSKLFNIIEPDVAVFGQKDAQQLRIIEKMVKDLNYDIEILSGEIVREKDGLAMSSRNNFLSKEERKEALVLKSSLDIAKKYILEGELDPKKIQTKIKESIVKRYKNIKIDYFEIVNYDELKEVEEISGKILIAGAFYLGKTRIIDNIIMDI